MSWQQEHDVGNWSKTVPNERPSCCRACGTKLREVFARGEPKKGEDSRLIHHTVHFNKPFRLLISSFILIPCNKLASKISLFMLKQTENK